MSEQVEEYYSCRVVQDTKHELRSGTYRTEVNSSEARSHILDFSEHAFVIFPFVVTPGLAICINASDTEARVVLVGLNATTFKPKVQN